jgi:hypothetical protein
MKKEKYKARLLRVQRLINIKMAKAYRTVSHEAYRTVSHEAYRTVSHKVLYVLTGTMPIDLKKEKAARMYQLTKGNAKEKAQFDKDMEVRHWQHLAEASMISTNEKEEKGSMHIYTDGSKTDKGVGSGIAIFEQGNILKAYSTG